MLDDIKEQQYRSVFASVCQQLRERRRYDKGFTLDELRGLLESACIRRGNDWTGRGPAAEVVEEATIAAYEQVLAEWQGDPEGS